MSVALQRSFLHEEMRSESCDGRTFSPHGTLRPGDFAGFPQSLVRILLVGDAPAPSLLLILAGLFRDSLSFPKLLFGS